MTKVGMKTVRGLKAACAEVRSRIDPEQVAGIAALMREIRNAPEALRADLEFQTRIWTDVSLWRGGLMMWRHLNPTFLKGDGLRKWFAHATTQSLPENVDERSKALTELYDELIDRIRNGPYGAEPRVETLRTLALFFPRDFTALADPVKIVPLARSMGFHVGHPVRANRMVLDRLQKVVGEPDDDLESTVERMLLPIELHRLDEGIKQTGATIPSRFRTLWATLSESAWRANLRFDRGLVEALHLGLWADDQRHFSVLSGLSGTGKTQIALRYAMALTGAESDTGGPVEVISVHPGWHDPGPLLGYVNPLTGGYTRTEFLDFLLAATDDPDQPHVLILDEMNLSHPEQYFAPILSAMEIRDGEVPLHREDEEKLGVPRGVAYPANLVIIGTVNMDETTMGISDKVLDRAFTLEFWDIEPDRWPGWDGCGLGEAEKSTVRGILVELTKALSPARRHFGWRVIKEVVGFLEGRSRDAGIQLTAEDALDQVIYAKVLPKLRGSDTGRFRDCLNATLSVLKKHGLKRCAEKVETLKEDLESTGSCSFWR